MSRPAHPQTALEHKLERGDANIARCPLCGAWTWRGTCRTPHSSTIGYC